MGGRQSVDIATPAFDPSEWEYEPEQRGVSEDYGVYQTLRSVRTGARIDEYEFVWPNEEEYHYYLKSFNWRHGQGNVVQSVGIVEGNREGFCSNHYSANVYIEHILTRLSQIRDIPCPDNLYVLMEALEGYAKVYQHSKYFLIEENQICVDEGGNIKIWVNPDLSVNYPNYQADNPREEEGEALMVERLLAIVDSNTDKEIEPSPSFYDYFQQNRSARTSFEEARVLVLQYARMHATQIPTRFESVLTLDPSDSEYSEQDQRESAMYAPPPPPQYQNNPYPPTVQAYHPPNFQPAGGNFLPQPAMPVPQPIIGQPQPLLTIKPQPIQPPPVYYVPYYPRVQPASPAAPPPTQIQLGEQRDSYHENVRVTDQSDVMAGHAMVSEDALETFPQDLELYELDAGSGHSGKRIELSQYNQNQEVDDYPLEMYKQPKTSNNNNMRQSQQNHSQETEHHSSKKNHSLVQADDLVARSMPIKTRSGSGPQQLGPLTQQEHVVYSHISPKHSNKKPNQQLGQFQNSIRSKLRESGADRTEKSKVGLGSRQRRTKTQITVEPLRYFSSLEEEGEIDPDIVADMARYL